MTYEEALNMMETAEIRYYGEMTIADEIIELKNKCCEALEKQIPKKPTVEGDGYDDSGCLIYDTWYCPCCDEMYEIDYDDYSYCPKCGQALDWSDDI